ncbi:hypothetical protein [Novosphingobium sp. FSW06-99]|uniref:hypothetical protein n=1 Tax=Novosphingobium sp. FSW06-99 TaxID=1739113 RepID=UPI00076C1644|nr:hypothetical protein [Novosphingobium sp. FSW06-99]KUR80113.1 hypothetical protein AQZ49_03205 [Novosphingobium sp. FSW06-99]
MEAGIIKWITRGAMVMVTIVALATVCLAGYQLLERHRMAQRNRTVEGPLKVDPGDPVLISAHAFLDVLGPSTTGDGLRFAVMPSFGKRWIAISLSEHAGANPVRALIYDRSTGVYSRRNFDLPAPDAASFLRQWDNVTDGYSGEPRLLADGTPLAFERRRGSRLTSGVGNSPCHYDVLGDIAARRLARYIPELADLRVANLAEVLKGRICNTSIFQFGQMPDIRLNLPPWQSARFVTRAG